jgi:hypothetical protein
MDTFRNVCPVFFHFFGIASINTLTIWVESIKLGILEEIREAIHVPERKLLAISDENSSE